MKTQPAIRIFHVPIEYVWLFVSAVTAGVLSALTLRNGIQASPDAWAYWEGSVSLLEHGRYTLLSGERIVHWPPLFSAYLSIFQRIGDTTGRWLVVAMCMLGVLNRFVWGHHALWLSRSAQGRPVWSVYVCSLAFTTVLVTLCGSALLAHSLLLVFVGCVFQAGVMTVNAVTLRGYSVGVAVSGVLLGGAMLTHNCAIAYVGAVGVLLSLDSQRTLRTRLAASFAVFVLSVLPWLAMRGLSGQTASHSLGAPLYSPVAYAVQAVAGIADLLMTNLATPWPVRAVIGTGLAVAVAGLVLFPRRLGVPKSCQGIAVLAGVSLILLFALFNVTWVADGLSGRFLWFVPLSVVPLLLRVSHSKPILFVFLVALCLAVPGIRCVRAAAAATVMPLRPADAVWAPDCHIRPSYFLTTRNPPPPPAGVRRVAPPAYPWQERWSKMEISEKERGMVSFLP